MIGGGAIEMTAEAPPLNRDRILTLIGIAALVAIVLSVDWDVGFVAVTIATILTLLMPHATKGAASKVAWPTVLLICFIGGAVSAFASTTGILGAVIPLAVPFLMRGDVGVVAMIIALCIASSVVDSSPFSTSGALVVANTPDERRDYVYQRLLRWGMSMIIVAPVTAWAIFVLPGW